MPTRHTAVAAASAIAAISLAASITQAQQNWPTHAISMVVPFGAGSSSDTAARIIGARMFELLGQQVLVENTPGAGGMTGTARVVNAPPDGYMASFASTDTMAINQTMYKKPLYNAATDLAPVILTLEQPMVLIVKKDLPVSNLKEFIAYAKANQGTMQFGSSGVGSSSHLGCFRLNAALGITPVHVPYRGSGQAMQDLAGGRIDYFCALAAAAMPQLASKSMKAIAVLTREHSPLIPDLASAHEQGLSDFDSYFWGGFSLPKDTPTTIVARLNAAAADTLNTASVQERLRTVGVTVVAPERRSADYLARFLDGEIRKWAAIIKASGVSLD